MFDGTLPSKYSLAEQTHTFTFKTERTLIYKTQWGNTLTVESWLTEL